MWLSQKINNDPEVKKTLAEITSLIKQYSDPTDIDRSDDHRLSYKASRKKFWTVNITRCFKPNPWVYLTFLVIVAITGVILWSFGDVKPSTVKNWIELSFNISSPILVFGVTLSTVARSLNKSSRFASEYLKDSCNTIVFAYITFLTVLFAYLSLIFFPTTANSTLSKVLYSSLFSFPLAGTIWCLTSLVYVVVETIRCMDPVFSIKAGSNYASRKLSFAILKSAYLSAWRVKYSELLSDEIKKYQSIYSQEEYWSKTILHRVDQEDRTDDIDEYRISGPKDFDFDLGYKDFNFRKFGSLNELLEAKKAKLYLTTDNYSEFGIVYSGEPWQDFSKGSSGFCRFKKNIHVKENISLWEEHYYKLHDAFLRTTKEGNISHFKEYLNSIESVYSVLRKARKYKLVRENFPAFDNTNQYLNRCLSLYSKSVEWILVAKIDDELRESFLQAVKGSIFRQVEDEIRCGDRYTLEDFKRLIPEIYNSFHKHVTDKNSQLWDWRARMGSFYEYAGSLLSEHDAEIDADEKLQIQCTLYKGLMKWILMAKTHNDYELLKSLCKAARELVFPDNKIVFDPPKLIAWHFVLCGKILEWLMEEKLQISPNLFKLLYSDEYDHTSMFKFNFEELVSFYTESRKYDLRSDLHEFSTTEWEKNPLSGGGFGTPSNPFSYNDYMFIYLALLKIKHDEQPIAFEFGNYNLKGKIDKFKGIAKGIGLYRFDDQKKIFEKWLDACDKRYKDEDEERVAEAPLNEEIVSQYRDGFWEGYGEVNTFLSFCISQGHYLLKEDIVREMRFRQCKQLFMNSEMSAPSHATHDGGEISRYRDDEMLRGIVNQSATKVMAGDEMSQLDKACDWLENEGAKKKNGILLYIGNGLPLRELYENDQYVPSWKGDEGSVFEGYYRNYPIISKYLKKKDDEPTCIALNLQGWNGIELRPEVLEKKFGRVDVREWTDEEIDKAVDEGKIQKENINRAKGECLVEYELYWQLDKENLPRQFSVELRMSKQKHSDESNPKRQLPGKAGKKWTKGEDQRLTQSYKNGNSISEIAQEYQRTKNAIRSRLKKLDLRE